VAAPTGNAIDPSTTTRHKRRRDRRQAAGRVISSATSGYDPDATALLVQRVLDFLRTR